MVTTSCDVMVIFGDLMVIYGDGLGFYGCFMGLYCNDVFTVEFHGIYRNRQIIKSNPKAVSSYCSINITLSKKQITWAKSKIFIHHPAITEASRCSNPHEGVILHHFCSLSRKKSSSAWWLTYTSEKYDFVSWDDFSQLNGKS
jgi:hypothetical protein